MDSYSDAENAALYEHLRGWDDEDDFFLELVLATDAVLDVGCGPGLILRRARERGHSGRLVGVDPDRYALARAAAARTDVEWVPGRAADLRYDGEFGLAFMSANAFQCFVTDEELSTSLAAIRGALADGGRFAFGTRNPARRAWERWTPDKIYEYTDHAGRALTGWYRVDSVEDGVVTFVDVVADAEHRVLRQDTGRLRFLDVPELTGFLEAAGFRVDEVYGDWRREPLTGASESIVVVAVASS